MKVVDLRIHDPLSGLHGALNRTKCLQLLLRRPRKKRKEPSTWILQFLPLFLSYYLMEEKPTIEWGKVCFLSETPAFELDFWSWKNSKLILSIVHGPSNDGFLEVKNLICRRRGCKLSYSFHSYSSQNSVESNTFTQSLSFVHITEAKSKKKKKIFTLKNGCFPSG